MIQLLIKAKTIDAALAVMAVRGLTPVGVSKMHQTNAAISATTDGKVREVASWYGEPGLAEGTLLHFSPEVKND